MGSVALASIAKMVWKYMRKDIYVSKIAAKADLGTEYQHQLSTYPGVESPAWPPGLGWHNNLEQVTLFPEPKWPLWFKFVISWVRKTDLHRYVHNNRLSFSLTQFVFCKIYCNLQSFDVIYFQQLFSVFPGWNVSSTWEWSHMNLRPPWFIDASSKWLFSVHSCLKEVIMVLPWMYV